MEIINVLKYSHKKPNFRCLTGSPKEFMALYMTLEVSEVSEVLEVLEVSPKYPLQVYFYFFMKTLSN